MVYSFRVLSCFGNFVANEFTENVGSKSLSYFNHWNSMAKINITVFQNSQCENFWEYWDLFSDLVRVLKHCEIHFSHISMTFSPNSFYLILLSSSAYSSDVIFILFSMIVSMECIRSLGSLILWFSLSSSNIFLADPKSSLLVIDVIFEISSSVSELEIRFDNVIASD